MMALLLDDMMIYVPKGFLVFWYFLNILDGIPTLPYISLPLHPLPLYPMPQNRPGPFQAWALGLALLGYVGGGVGIL